MQHDPTRPHTDNPRHMALITLIDAHLGFGHVPLLDGANFALEVGERVGLIGRNGAGKSTLLKILGGLEKPDDESENVGEIAPIEIAPQLPRLDTGEGNPALAHHPFFHSTLLAHIQNTKIHASCLLLLASYRLNKREIGEYMPPRSSAGEQQFHA